MRHLSRKKSICPVQDVRKTIFGKLIGKILELVYVSSALEAEVLECGELGILLNLPVFMIMSWV